MLKTKLNYVNFDKDTLIEEYFKKEKMIDLRSILLKYTDKEQDECERLVNFIDKHVDTDSIYMGWLEEINTIIPDLYEKEDYIKALNEIENTTNMLIDFYNEDEKTNEHVKNGVIKRYRAERRFTDSQYDLVMEFSDLENQICKRVGTDKLYIKKRINDTRKPIEDVTKDLAVIFYRLSENDYNSILKGNVNIKDVLKESMVYTDYEYLLDETFLTYTIFR